MKPKIQQILEHFDGHDLNRMDKYLNSPFFNENEEVQALYRVLCRYRETGVEWPDSTVIYGQAFKGKAYDNKHYRYVCSFLSRHLEDYLVHKHLEQHPREWLRHKQKTLLERNAEKAYRYQKEELDATLASGTQDALVHFFRHEMALHQMEYDAGHLTRKSSFSFGPVMDELDKYYIAKKLQVACEILNAQNVQSENYSIRLLDAIRTLAASKDFEGIPSIQMYRAVLQTLTEPDTVSHFYQLRQLVIDRAELFPLREQKELYQYLKNYCVKQINTGRPEFIEELFGIYKINLGNRKLMRSEPLSPWEYKNIVTIGLRMKEQEWVRHFITDYNVYLDPAHRHNAEVYNTANWYFHAGDYRQALRLFREVEFTDLYYQLDVRAIQLKAYYELGEEETLLYHLSAFRTFLSRNRLVSDYQRRIYRNLVRFTGRLVRAGTGRKKLETLLDDLRRERQVADFRWLEEKVSVMCDAN